MPQAVLRESAYNCRTENDQRLWERSPRLFSNPTKQDRYGAQKYYALPGGCSSIRTAERRSRLRRSRQWQGPSRTRFRFLADRSPFPPLRAR